MARKLSQGDIKQVLEIMLNDDEFWAGGISKADKILTETHGMTTRQAGNFAYAIYKQVTKIWDGKLS